MESSGNRACLYCKFVILSLCWALCGFIHGGHWLIIMCLARDGRQRWMALAFSASIWFGVLITALGGTWCRSGTSVDCPGGETMSRACLWDQQRPAYQVIYTIHYVGLAWSFSHWILDGMQLLCWCWRLSRNEQLTFFTSDVEVRVWHYSAVVLCTTLVVTLTWTCLYDWSTDEGLGALAGVLFAEIVCIGLATWLGMTAVGMYAEFKTFIKGFHEEG